MFVQIVLRFGAKAHQQLGKVVVARGQKQPPPAGLLAAPAQRKEAAVQLCQRARQAARRFAQRLANTAGVPVVMWDERRTTVSAAAILADNDTFGAKRKERLDSVSAAVILESFLNWRAHHPGEEPPELVRPEQ